MTVALTGTPLLSTGRLTLRAPAAAETMEITTPGLEIEVYRHPHPEKRP